MLLFNKLPIDIQDIILSYVFDIHYKYNCVINEIKNINNLYINNIIIHPIDKFYSIELTDNILENKEKYKKNFYEYWKTKYNIVSKLLFYNNIEHKIDISRLYSYNNLINILDLFESISISNEKCAYCHCYTSYTKLFYKYPIFKLYQNYHKKLSRTILKNYNTLYTTKVYIMCNGCYYGYSKNKNIKFYIPY